MDPGNLNKVATMTDPTMLERLRACGMSASQTTHSGYCKLNSNIENASNIRLLGRLETFSTARHHLNFYKNVSCAATYTKPSSTIPIETLIFRALSVVIGRYSMLSAIPLNEDKSYPNVYFARLPSIDLRTCVEFIERKGSVGDGERDEELDAVLQKQHNRNFLENVGTKPFWRLVVLYGTEHPGIFTAAWIFHHALADGTSGLVFHRTLRSALQSVSTAEHASDPLDPLIESPNTHLLPPLEELHPLPISPLFLIKALLGSLFPKWFDPRPPKLWTGGPISADPSFMTARFRSLIVSSATTKQLLELSRKNKTTMTGTLQCIIASAVLSNLDADKFERVKVDGPISMRRFMKWDGGNLDDELVSGMTEYGYVHTRSTFMSTVSSFSWDEARAVRTAIQRELGKKGNDSVVGLLRYVPDIHKFFKEKVGKERINSFEMSNIGAYKDEQQEKDDTWRIGRVMFSQCPNVTGAAFATSVATGGDGCAAIAFTWYDGIVEGVFMERIVESVEKEVEALVEANTQD